LSKNTSESPFSSDSENDSPPRTPNPGSTKSKSSKTREEFSWETVNDDSMIQQKNIQLLQAIEDKNQEITKFEF